MTPYLGPISTFLGAKRALFTKVNGESEKGKCLLGLLAQLNTLRCCWRKFHGLKVRWVYIGFIPVKCAALSLT